jgi:hypothetical protein
MDGNSSTFSSIVPSWVGCWRKLKIKPKEFYCRRKELRAKKLHEADWDVLPTSLFCVNKWLGCGEMQMVDKNGAYIYHLCKHYQAFFFVWGSLTNNEKYLHLLHNMRPTYFIFFHPNDIYGCLALCIQTFIILWFVRSIYFYFFDTIKMHACWFVWDDDDDDKKGTGCGSCHTVHRISNNFVFSARWTMYNNKNMLTNCKKKFLYK